MKLIDIFPILNEEFPRGDQSAAQSMGQNPRSMAIKQQLFGLISNTDFDDNQAVDTLKMALEQILEQL